MKHARLFNQYRYEMEKFPGDGFWPRDGNLGDPIQCLAVENIYAKAGIKDLLLVNRDDLNTYDKEECSVVMQSWFGDYANLFPLPWSKKINPVFIGFHLSKIGQTRQRFITEKIAANMIPYQPIGCRDRNTRDFLLKQGVQAYFSGCLTLTFDKRTVQPKNGKIFVVDLTASARKILPKHIFETADFSITHFYYWNNYPLSYEGALEFENQARTILERYKNEAKLVITSKIHCAMPCIAMGIPVIFIHEDAKDCERFDVLQGIIPMYRPQDAKYINWNPSPTNIDCLKKAIIKNTNDRIIGDSGLLAIDELEKITNKLKPIDIKTEYIKYHSEYPAYFYHQTMKLRMYILIKSKLKTIISFIRKK
ncbi:hypothetical protein FACS189450_13430 [Spirochaetia bacterium]|nr:hypothetical protein FACS189450_13430 [Spirochaetia bacterium]